MQETQQNKSEGSSAKGGRLALARSRGPVNYGGRINFIRVIFVLVFLAIVAKLGIVQGVNGIYYQKIAQKQYESRVLLHANRGMIYDRNGSLIVSNNYGYSYAADPELLDPSDKAKIAQRFAAVFGQSSSYFLNKLNTKARFIWLARNVDPDQSSALQNFKMYGLIQLQEQQRLYPYGAVAGQILGFTNVDGKGASGVELEFDSLLAGMDGFEIMQRDGIGRKMPSIDYPHVNPISGCNVQLTLDMNIQQIVEQELAAGVERAKAAAGTAVFMNPNTGEVLAIANYPSFNPSDYEKYTFSDSRDRAITDVFEPGSTFKVVTASAALEEGIEKPSDMIFAENGSYTLYGRLIEDFEREGWITFRRAVELSSNIAFSKIGRKIGSDKFYRYARDFGFGVPTGIELPGEIPGELKKPYEWSKVSLPFMSFGYEVMVTTLQMAQAYAAIANGGTLMKPYIVNKITDANGNIIFQNEPMKIRRVVTPDVAQTLSGLFVDVVERGTGVAAKMNDVLVAGKTGTAQKLVDGKYSKKFYHASFAGFFPVPNPEIVGYIMIDSPMNGYTGGAVAAPIFKRIATRIYGIMQRRTTNVLNTDVRLVSNGNGEVTPPSRNSVEVNSNVDQSNLVKVPDVSFLDCATATAILKNFGLTASSAGKGDFIVSEKPAAGAIVPKGSEVQLNLVDARHVTKMPDFRGASVRKATSFLLSAGIPFHVVGSGEIVGQSPNAGQSINKKITVIINCDNKGFNVFQRILRTGLY